MCIRWELDKKWPTFMSSLPNTKLIIHSGEWSSSCKFVSYYYYYYWTATRRRRWTTERIQIETICVLFVVHRLEFIFRRVVLNRCWFYCPNGLHFISFRFYFLSFYALVFVVVVVIPSALVCLRMSPIEMNIPLHFILSILWQHNNILQFILHCVHFGMYTKCCVEHTRIVCRSGEHTHEKRK